MTDEETAVTRRTGRRAGTQSLIELEERVKIAELHARGAEAKVRLNAAKEQLASNRKSRKMGKEA